MNGQYRESETHQSLLAIVLCLIFGTEGESKNTHENSSGHYLNPVNKSPRFWRFTTGMQLAELNT
jgi:hypothetical protein